MRRWAPFVAAYVLTAALVLPRAPLAADEQPVADADPSITTPSAPPTALPSTPPVAVPGASSTAPPSASHPAAPGSAPTPPSEPAPSGASGSAPSSASEPAAPLATVPPASAPDTATPPADAASERSAPERPVLARAAAPGAVTIADFSFRPATVTVDVGDSVTWSNQDDVEHTATGSSGSFDTGLIEPGASASATFDEAGSFSYICTPHPFMKGTVVVRGASGGGDTPTEAPAPTTDSTDTGGSTGSVAGAEAAPSGPSLPNTGLDALLLAGLGVLFLGLGALVNRRAADPPPPGRAGW
jgi:LPXTG-motif cell wall-anchored protein